MTYFRIAPAEAGLGAKPALAVVLRRSSGVKLGDRRQKETGTSKVPASLLSILRSGVPASVGGIPSALYRRRTFGRLAAAPAMTSPAVTAAFGIAPFDTLRPGRSPETLHPNPVRLPRCRLRPFAGAAAASLRLAATFPAAAPPTVARSRRLIRGGLTELLRQRELLHFSAP